MIDKLKRKCRKKIITKTQNTKFYFYLYPSYWHALIKSKSGSGEDKCYFSARPNPDAGIGHQMANWIAGLWFSKLFGVKFAHYPFSSLDWEKLLSLGEGNPSVEELKKFGYKIRRVPLFNEDSIEEIHVIKKIIESYRNQKVVLLAEQDQFYKDQFGVIEELRRKFYVGEEEHKKRLIFNNDSFNVVVHVRRGDIVQSCGENNPNLTMRYQKNDYFVKALDIALKNIPAGRKISIYLFSQGLKEDFPEFASFDNLQFCCDMNAYDSFLHMVYADILVTSKSSFSYKAALINRGIKVAPANFWHGYPDNDEWILLDDSGEICKIKQLT